jgi:sulfur-oxidizing protein SoxX
MRNARIAMAIAGVASLVAATVGPLPALSADAAKEPTGQDLAFDRRKGNCLACHQFPTLQTTKSSLSKDYTAANIGPPMIAMSKRFPNKADLKAQISDPMAKNPDTLMPPFGKHKILSEKEIDLVTDFIYGL